MNILMVGNHETVKGGITTVINQFKEFDWGKKGIKFSFIPTYVDKNNILKILFFILAYIRIFLYFVFSRPNIIHVHMSYKGSFTRAYLIQKLALKFGVKNVIHLHGSEFKKWFDSLDDGKKQNVKFLLRNSDVFIVLGEKWDRVIKEIEPKTRTCVLNNCVKIPNEKAKYNSKKTLLYLGVLIKRKGVSDLIEALHKLNDDYELLIAGTGGEEEYLKKLVFKHNLGDNVKFLGWVDSKEEILLKSQFMILPSYNEGLPMSLLEAMSYGIPVLSTDVGDISSVVKNENNGFLVKPGDVTDLVRKLNLFLKMDECEYNDFSDCARNTIKKDFSEDIYFEKILNLYKRM